MGTWHRGKWMTWGRCTIEKTRRMVGEGSSGMKRDEETVCRDFKGEEGWRQAAEKRRISDRGACSTVCLGAFQPTAVKRGFERSYQFLSWALQKRPAARGEGVTRSLARDGWRREAGSASTRYIIIHLLLSPKPPASEPPTHQDTFLLQPKAAGLTGRPVRKYPKSDFRWPLTAKLSYVKC